METNHRLSQSEFEDNISWWETYDKEADDKAECIRSHAAWIARAEQAEGLLRELADYLRRRPLTLSGHRLAHYAIEDGKPIRCYIHPLGVDGETFDFELPFLNPTPPTDKQE